MDMLQRIPFEKGQEAESKSHLVGFRGAWFRCKVKDVKIRNGEYWCYLEYFDFPDEKVRWTKVYQKDPADKSSQQQKKKNELMLRPCFPRFSRECEVADTQNHSALVAIVHNEWEVGNLVDWWSDGCFWSGRIGAILDNNKVRVDLPKPPIGEGISYQVDCRELRPTLLWSIESGWSVPLCENEGNFRPCVHLSIPLKIDTGKSLHGNIPAQDPPAERLTELKPQHGEELRKLHSNPNYDDKLLDIIQRKDLSYRFDELPGTHNNLSDSVQLLCETDGGKQCTNEAGVNLGVGRSKSHPEVTVNSEQISRNALHSNCNIVRHGPKEVGSYSLSHNPGISHQECYLVGAKLDMDASPPHIGITRNNCHQSIMNDSLSETERNTFPLSTYKKKRARVILEKARSFHHGKGRLKHKCPSVDNNHLSSVDCPVGRSSNNHGKSLIGIKSNIRVSSSSLQRHPLPDTIQDFCSINLRKLEDSLIGKSELPADRSLSTDQFLLHLERKENGRRSSCMDIDMESSVMALEELVHKVRWLRGFMKFGFNQCSDTTGTTWQFFGNEMSQKEAGGNQQSHAL